jgi:gliding motility-associated protein GldL
VGSSGISDSSRKLIDVADQIAQLPELVGATQKYLEQLSKISNDLEQFSALTESLSGVSNGINRNSQSYIQQMEALTRNVAGLNTIYELQLKSISSQISSIEHINSGLNRIKELYDGSIVDSSVFRNETEKMAQQLSQLNMVYARLLQAMTVNMGIPK